MTPSFVPSTVVETMDVQVQLADKLAAISQVINDASLASLEEQQAAKSEAVRYYSELEAILRAAAAQVNDFTDQRDLRQAAQQLRQLLQERNQQLQAATEECAAAKAAGAARETAAAQQLARLKQQHAQEIAQQEQSVSAAEREADGHAQRAHSLEAQLQQQLLKSHEAQRLAQERGAELQSELRQVRRDAEDAVAASRAAAEELHLQHAEAEAALQQRAALAVAAAENTQAESKASFEAQQQMCISRSGALSAAVALGLEQALGDLDAISAAFPTIMHQREQRQDPESSTALSVLRQWSVSTGQEELYAALETLWTALRLKFGDIREALSLALQKQLLQVDSANEAKAASDRLELLMQSHKELEARCQQQQTQIEQENELFDAKLAHLQHADAASAAAAQAAQMESAASATRCAALQERLDILQQQCDALHLNCQRQLAELATGAESSVLLQHQLAALRQEHENLRHQHAEAGIAANGNLLRLLSELDEARRQNAGLERSSQQLEAANATELQQCATDWETKWEAEQQTFGLQLQEDAAAAAALRQQLEQQWSQRLEEQIRADNAETEEKLATLAAQRQAQMEAAQAAAAKLAENAEASQRQAADQLAAAVNKCADLQSQLDRQASAMNDLGAAAAQRAADAAAERLEQALVDQRLQLQSDFDTQLLQREAAAADALQQALDSAAEHQQMLLAQAESERRQVEEAHEAAIDDLRRDHGAEQQQQAAAHAALCQELHAQAEADAAAAAKLGADAAASQQTAAQMGADAAAAREAQLQGALTRVSADFRAEVAALEEAASRERRSHQHLLAAARLEAEQKLASAMAAAEEVRQQAVQKQADEHEQKAAALAADHAAELQCFEQQLEEQRAAEQAAQTTQRRLEQAIEDAGAQLEAAKQQAQDVLGQLAAEHADALAVSYDELSAQQAAAQARAEAAAAMAAAKLRSVQEEAALETAALSTRVAALEREQADRPPRPEDLALLAEVRQQTQEQEARAQAAEVALYSLRKEVLLHSDGDRGGIKPAGLADSRKLGQTLAAQSGVMAWMRDAPAASGIWAAGRGRASPIKTAPRKPLLR